MWTKRFWKQAAERAAKTAAQVALAYLALVGVGDIGDPRAVAAILPDWQSVAVTTAAVALFGAIFSLLTSLGSAKLGPDSSPSLVEVGD